MAKALLTGITGQDGSWLSELLISKGYEVHGLIRRNSAYNLNNIEHLKDVLKLHYGDLTSEHDLACLIHDLQPDELYNLAAQSDVKLSFECPEYTMEVNHIAVMNMLQAIRLFSPKTKFYQASTSEMFGNTPPPQNEASPMKPESPYGISKLAAYHECINYRNSYDLFICNGILYNHESERRGLNFVTRKITHAVANIYYDRQDKLELGNLESKRDWGYAPDYVEAMWLMLQQSKPDDYVVGSGENHSVKEFAIEAFTCLNLDWKSHVKVNPAYYRPSEVNNLCADATKAHEVLGWYPKTSFKDLVNKMVLHDLKKIKGLVKV